jgi:tetratricopeptide (TPR) repeat protein
MTKRFTIQPDSPEKYIRTRARSLPLGDCFISQNWLDSGMAMILVSRKHVTGNITFGGYQVDMYCLGVKDTFWRFNEPPEVMEDILKQFSAMNFLGEKMGKVNYELVHNIIYGAEGYAEDLGFSTHKDFDLTKYILEEDDEQVEFMDIEFGMDGYPAVMMGMESLPKNIFQVLDRSVGKGNYFVIEEDGTISHDPSDDNPGDSVFSDEDQRPVNRDMIDLANERLMKYLEEQNFGTIEEAKEFFEKNILGKSIDETIPPNKGRKSKSDVADDLMYQAYQKDTEQAMIIANKALEVDPENVRAYNYLASHEPLPAKALALFEKAALTAEKQLGKDYFKKYKGHFWGMTETRSYMSARLGMAECLTAMGKIKEAIGIYEHILTLNPNDNQGVRYGLSDLYLMSRKSDKYLKLFKKYEDDESAYWLYKHAFFWYDTMGPGKEFQKALRKAIKTNSHIFNILTGKERVLKNPKDFLTPGDANEAAEYIYAIGELWQANEPLLQELKRYKNSRT